MDLDESGFVRIIENLWSFNMWGSKPKRARKILNDNGIENIRRSLNDLLYGSKPLEERFDDFNVKYLGMASITEILITMSPDKYALWNDRTRKVLQAAKTTQIPRSAFKSSKISGSDYAKCNETMREISSILIDEGYQSEDLDLDLFIALTLSILDTSSTKTTKTTETTPPPDSDMDHWKAIGMITETGNALEFDTYVSDRAKKYGETTLGEIATQADIPEQYKGVPGIGRIDAIWFKHELPLYMFEVEDGGNMRDALLRLFNAQGLISRFMVVCPAKNKDKFEKWVNIAPFKKYKQRYQFRLFDDLRGMHKAAMDYDRARKRFLTEPDLGSSIAPWCGM